MDSATKCQPLSWQYLVNDQKPYACKKLSNLGARKWSEEVVKDLKKDVNKCHCRTQPMI